MKKLLYKVPLLLCCLIMLCSMSGCFIAESKLPEYDNEYFRYAVRTEKGKKKGYLIGLTELGTEQTELILPQEIDGVPILGIGYSRKNTWWTAPIGRLVSDNLKKLYINFSIDNWGWEGTAIFENCFEVYLKYNIHKIGGGGGDIVSYPVYDKIINPEIGYGTNTVRYTLLANVSYMYNYEFAENDGYYWVDSYDNETISFIPPEPERSGYAFGGWYKEPECINAWDFETDKTGEKLVVDDNTIAHYGNNYLPTLPSQYTEKDGLKLYAKWIKN